MGLRTSVKIYFSFGLIGSDKKDLKEKHLGGRECFCCFIFYLLRLESLEGSRHWDNALFQMWYIFNVQLAFLKWSDSSWLGWFAVSDFICRIQKQKSPSPCCPSISCMWRGSRSRDISINVYIQNEQTGLILGLSTLTALLNQLAVHIDANPGIGSKELTIQKQHCID